MKFHKLLNFSRLYLQHCCE